MRRAILLPASIAALLTGLAAQAIAAGSTYAVDSTEDLPDVDPADGVCAAIDGHCTLRAAVMQANNTPGADTITVPAGNYVLTRAGDDDVALVGDLDLTDSVTVQGAGAGLTIVDGNGAVTGDRVFDIQPGAVETSLNGMTIRNGQRNGTFDMGGGLRWQGGGGHAHLARLILEDNHAAYLAGLDAEFAPPGGAFELDTVVVRNNVATAAGAGLGASFSPGVTSFTMRNSQVYGNSAYEGGGLYFQGDLQYSDQARIENSEVYANTASLSAGMENHGGSAAIPLEVVDGLFHDNQADFQGGAITNYGFMKLDRTTLEANGSGMDGGGLYNEEGATTDIVSSTISGNTAQNGGGIYSALFIHSAAALTLTNSTLSGNSAIVDGGGIYAEGGQVGLFNATIAENLVDKAFPDNGGTGGGIYATSPAVVAAVNTLVAGNHKASLTSMGQEDDCNGALLSGGFNLIRDPTGCSISGSTAGNVTGQDPLLGPLRFHGGPTKTRALLPGSPALDAGQTPACLDAASDTLTTDQRGSARPYGTRCDIGAYEAPEPGAAALGGATLATLLAWSRVRSRAPARG